MAMVVCSNCGSPNPGTNRVCENCSSSLLGAPALLPEGTAPSSVPQPLAETRIFSRQISVFTDTHRLTGELDLRFARLTDALSSEALETFMLRSCLVTP